MYYTDEDVARLKMPILDNFHPPTDTSPTWHIRPDEMARAILDAIAPAIAARALREAAVDLRRHWSNDAIFASMDDSEMWYSADRWIEVYAERIERMAQR